MAWDRAGCCAGARAELPALACACRVEGPRRSCAEGEGFLQKSPSKETHFTDVSGGAAAGAWDTAGSTPAARKGSGAAAGG